MSAIHAWRGHVPNNPRGAGSDVLGRTDSGTDEDLGLDARSDF